MNPSKMWTVSNTWCAISVATWTAAEDSNGKREKTFLAGIEAFSVDPRKKN